MEKIQAFAKAGGKVIAIRETPALCYGWPGWREKSARVREIASQVFGSGSGRVVADENNSLLRALRDSHPPDIDFQTADPEVGFVHRRTPEHEFYFIANTSAAPKRLQAVFRVGRRRPEVWDPLTGRTQQVEDYAYERGGTSMPIVLGPYASTIIAFGKAAPAPERIPDAAAHLREGWRLPARGLSKSTAIRCPWIAWCSWTEHDRLRYFSGSGVYRTEFDLKEFAGRLWLDLGSVREIADIELNSRPAGVAWMTPYRLDITGKAQPGRNTLTVKVTNLLINRVLGQPEPDVTALVEKFGEKFRQLGERPDLKFTQNTEKRLVREPLPSGLLGPVEIYSE